MSTDNFSSYFSKKQTPLAEVISSIYFLLQQSTFLIPINVRKSLDLCSPPSEKSYLMRIERGLLPI